MTRDGSAQAGTAYRFWKGGFETRKTAAWRAALARVVAVAYVHLAGWLAAGLARLRRRRLPAVGPVTVLTIGPFYSGNWVAAQLEPLTRADGVGSVLVITPDHYRAIERLEYVTPPAWLRRVVSMPVARALQALITAVRRRPEVIIGYHLPWNGVVALLAGRLVGARTAYFSVGGPAEIVGGGLYSEHALFSRQGRENQRAERGLLRLAASFDDIVTMGSDGVRYLRHHGIERPVWPVSVGVDASRFSSETDTHGGDRYDLITVSRLARIKRVDLFLEVVAAVTATRPDTRAIIVGDGEERAALEAAATRLGLTRQVDFAGWTDDVTPLLQRSRVFTMTSASEGLPLSLIEAMLCRLPAVVPRVGDLPDLVKEGENGHLVAPGAVDAAARAVLDLLSDAARRDTLGTAARRAALHYSVAECAHRWERFLSETSG